MKSSLPKAPKHLSAEASRLWKKITGEYTLDDQAALAILAVGLEAFDRMRQAQAALVTDGLIVEDRFGQKKQHPATLIERDSRSAMLAALKQLHLDIEPLNDGPGRPCGS